MLFKNNCLVAAPMAGISDTVFRTLCKEMGADIVVSEMVSVDGIVYGADATMDLLRFYSFERPVGVQLFGSNPEQFKKSAEITVERFHPDFIDLNAGCPVQKVVKKNGGASLLKDLGRFAKIVTALVTTISLPVTVKLRSGWFKNQWVDCEFARCAESCGAAAITLHPRSQTMGFSGHSFWDRIAAVKSAVSIPVIGNGDVKTTDDALSMKAQTGCDGIMIGRGALGNPWIFSEVKKVLAGEMVCRPSSELKRETALRHITRYCDRYGEVKAAREMKKHVAWYLKGMTGAAQWRDRIFRATSTGELISVIEEVFRE
jgi:tRNA-dihydrouridine synthase B